MAPPLLRPKGAETPPPPKGDEAPPNGAEAPPDAPPKGELNAAGAPKGVAPVKAMLASACAPPRPRRPLPPRPEGGPPNGRETSPPLLPSMPSPPERRKGRDAPPRPPRPPRPRPPPMSVSIVWPRLLKGAWKPSLLRRPRPPRPPRSDCCCPPPRPAAPKRSWPHAPGVSARLGRPPRPVRRAPPRPSSPPCWPPPEDPKGVEKGEVKLTDAPRPPPPDGRPKGREGSMRAGPLPR